MAGTGGGEVTDRFFDDLVQRGHDPLLRKARGTIKFEIVDGKRVDRRIVAIDRGDITVSRRSVTCDGVIRANREVFERIASGRSNPIAAVLRNELFVQGDWRLLVLVQRLFPGPPKARPSRRAAGYAKRR
ncbi:MAG TPA: SCP2 sterol-binding domain-containing protein [Gaiellaceae bacterium]|nr:SCP2 sterol-binding domain-containing protein [Gaiellaceae bacterium]